MTINEVRVGNYVVVPDIGACRICNIVNDGITIRIGVNGHITVPISDCQPVQITPDVLEAFGFVKEKDEQNYISYAVPSTTEIFTIYNNSVHNQSEFFFEHDGGLGAVEIKIDSAHRLQNLYFALTGIELEYKTERI